MTITPLTVVAVALGGMIGALARLGVVWAVHRDLAHSHWTIAAVNLAGSLLLGVVAGWATSRSGLESHHAGLITVGVLGSFTTFSTFSLDALRLLQAGRTGEAAAHLLVSVAGGLACVLAGFAGARWLVHTP